MSINTFNFRKLRYYVILRMIKLRFDWGKKNETTFRTRSFHGRNFCHSASLPAFHLPHLTPHSLDHQHMITICEIPPRHGIQDETEEFPLLWGR